MADWYCQEVVAGHVPACHWEELACKRYLAMRKAAQGGKAAFVWSDAHAIDVCGFLELLPHTLGFEGPLTLQPVQCWWMAAIFGFRDADTGLRYVRDASLWIPRKNGKDVALDTPIPTPRGWTTMRQVRVGDRVIAPDGTATTVVAESPVFVGHDCFRMRFSNGEQIVAGADHQWVTTARVDKVGAGIGQGRNKSGLNLSRTRTTREIFETQRYGARGDRNHSLAMPAPIVGEQRQLPLDPYVLGLWLGNGHTAESALTSWIEDRPHYRAALTAAGIAFSERADKQTCWRYNLREDALQAVSGGEAVAARPLTGRMRQMGVIGRKHIPPIYLRASAADRLALLQGMMDTDGTISKDGRCLSYSTTQEELATGVCELLATFGVKYSTKRKPSRCQTGPCRDHWSIQFYVSRDALPVFRLERKLCRMRREGDGPRARSRTVQITSVEPVASVPTKCISVDHPSHQFLIGRTMLPTHNTLVAAGLVLFCANCEGEPGAQVVISAGSEKQAEIPYTTIQRMLELEPDLSARFGGHTTTTFTDFTRTGGEILLVATRAKNIDGLNPHMVLAEELHAQSQEVIGVLRTAQGSRRNPLFLSISSAGRDINAPAYNDWKTCQAVLEGRMPAPRLFTALYAGDEKDEAQRFSRGVVEKLNPLWGQALNTTSMETEVMQARKSEADLQEYKRTRLNIWSRAAGNLLSVDAWEKCADASLKLDLLKGFPLYVGIDLASRSDLNAASYLIEIGDTVYAVSDYWLCERAERLQTDRFADAFFGWARDGWLTLTPGGFIDFRVILGRILERLDGHNVVGVALDDYQANMMAAEIEAAGYQTFIVRKNAKSLTPATEDLIARHRDAKMFQHDGNPITTWCAGNVVGYWDNNENVLPKKESRDSKANIDGIDALILGNAIRIDHKAGVLGMADRVKQKPNPYLERGLAGYGSAIDGTRH